MISVTKKVPSSSNKLVYKMTTSSRHTSFKCKPRRIRFATVKLDKAKMEFMPGLSQNRFILTLASASSILQSESWGEGTWRQLKSDNSPRLKMWRLSPYQDLLKIGKSRGGAIFLDIGSCGKNHHLSISLKIVTYFS
jgi:hypothetical protein